MSHSQSETVESISQHDGHGLQPRPEATRLARHEVRNVIIIGSGPAGLTAALYAARANLSPLVLEGDGFEQTQPGGQLMTTTEIENYPGLYHRGPDGKFLHGFDGREMMDVLRTQAQHFGAECRQLRVTRVDLRCRPFRIEVDEEKFYAESVIIATGASARWLGVKGEDEYKNFGVTACATCDGAFFKGKDVIVVGGGDTAMEEAIYLTRHCRTVTVVHRRDQLRASKIMSDRAAANEKIRWVWNAAVEEIYGQQEGMRKFVTGVKLRNTVTGEITDFPTDGVFVAIGHKPNTDLFVGQLDMDEAGYLKTAKETTFTNIPGVFACGDCQDHVYRQAITAAGTGCMAAIDAERFITANPLLYGIEEEVSHPYEEVLDQAIIKADEMPVKEPTTY